MSNFMFRPAKRENVGLLIGLAGGTGSGKTYSALRLAKGIAGEKPFALIDTEAGRAKHYADQFRFDHGDLHGPFRPNSYAEAIAAADKAGYAAIVVDSMSHVWAGEGGVLDWQEAELDRMAGDDHKRRDACKMAAWIKPKMAHKQMVQKLLQVRAHLVLCFRAEEKVEIRKNRETGKTEIVPKEGPTGLHGWMPVCEKNLPFELTVSFLLTADKPGVPQPIKLQEQHKPIFQPGKLIDEECGRRLAAWAVGGQVQRAEIPADTPQPVACISGEQWKELQVMGERFKLSREQLGTLFEHTFGSRPKTAQKITKNQFETLMAKFEQVAEGATDLDMKTLAFVDPPEDSPDLNAQAEAEGVPF